MVVMNGDAMTAGSRPSFCAAIGRVQPTSFASTMVMISVRQTTSATSGEIETLPKSSLSTSIIFAKAAAAMAQPQSTATRISFQMTSITSRNSISPSEMPRITVTEAWLPELPPVSISMGMNEVSTTCAASAFSKLVMIMPVKVAETMSRSSQGMRCFQISKTLERRYSCSDGSIAAIFSISSVASSSSTSTASSIVTIPTSLSS